MNIKQMEQVLGAFDSDKEIEVYELGGTFLEIRSIDVIQTPDGNIHLAIVPGEVTCDVPRMILNNPNDREKIRKKRVIVLGNQNEVCAHCEAVFLDSDYAKMSRAIMKQKPYCSYECNKALGQVK
jgi:hypothetical protein